jgi:hypothetical protein
MIRVIQYYSRFEQARGGFGALPRWARTILGILAIPAIALATLSILLLGISILALLLLTVPAYRLLKTITGTGARSEPPEDMVEAAVVSRDESVAPRRPIEVKILEQ